jgi:putative SOS response-associated peptidase YedK
MPLVIGPRSYAAWLDPATADPQALVASFDGELSARPVSTLVNDPKNDDSRLLEPIPASSYAS